MYHSMYRPQDKKIPIPLALLLILLLVASAVAFIKKPEFRRASESTVKVVDSKIGNIRDNTVTIYWRTSEKSKSYLIYGRKPDVLTQEVYDEKDTSNNLTDRNNHMVVLNGLSPNTTYYYRLINNNAETGHIGGDSFNFKTTRRVASTLDIPPIYGKITNKNGTPARDAIVSLSISSSYPILARSKNDGSFLLSPCCIFDSSTAEPFYPTGEQKVMLEITSEEGNKDVLKRTLADVSPFSETIVIGTQKNALADKGKVLSEMDERESVLLKSGDVEHYNAIDIIYPREGSVIPGSKPLIKGFGEPGKSIEGRIEPDGKLFRTNIKENRIWSFSPSFTLDPGEHTLSVVTEDAFGESIKLSRGFVILKSGESVLGSATPSASLTPELSPSPEPTTEVEAETPTPEPTIDTLSPTPTIDPTGSNVLPAVTLSLALIILGMGVILIYR